MNKRRVKEALKLLALLLLLALFVVWLGYYYTTCTPPGRTLADVPSWCLLMR